MIYSDLFKGGIAGFILGLLTCMAVILIWGSVSSPFFKVTNQTTVYPQNSQLNSTEARLNLLENQVGRINERLSDVSITAMRDQVILQREDMAALAREFYELKNK